MLFRATATVLLAQLIRTYVYAGGITETIIDFDNKLRNHYRDLYIRTLIAVESSRTLIIGDDGRVRR